MKRRTGVSPDWIKDSMRWRGKVLTGEHAHWCNEWDWLPVDETCDEWPCGCVVTGYPDGIDRCDGVPVTDPRPAGPDSRGA